MSGTMVTPKSKRNSKQNLFIIIGVIKLAVDRRIVYMQCDSIGNVQELTNQPHTFPSSRINQRLTVE
jgi:hypothetical protein